MSAALYGGIGNHDVSTDLLEALIELDAWVTNESGAHYPEGTFEVVRAAIAKAREKL
jgi:hypothetical protein